jgi:hypothetical protein
MSSLDRHQGLLLRRWAEELKALERRRQVVLGAATEAGQALRHRWPASVAIPISISPWRACRPTARSKRWAWRNTSWMPALAAAGEDAIGADLVRLEALPPHWQGRIRDHALPLG